jgi:hypothetical protein
MGVFGIDRCVMVGAVCYSLCRYPCDPTGEAVKMWTVIYTVMGVSAFVFAVVGVWWLNRRKKPRYIPRREADKTYVIRDTNTGKDLVGEMALGTAQDMCDALNDPDAFTDGNDMEIPPVFECPSCHGAKVEPNTELPCGTCGGVGKINAFWMNIYRTIHNV